MGLHSFSGCIQNQRIYYIVCPWFFQLLFLIPCPKSLPSASEGCSLHNVCCDDRITAGVDRNFEIVNLAIPIFAPLIDFTASVQNPALTIFHCIRRIDFQVSSDSVSSHFRRMDFIHMIQQHFPFIRFRFLQLVSCISHDNLSPGDMQSRTRVFNGKPIFSLIFRQVFPFSRKTVAFPDFFWYIIS